MSWSSLADAEVDQGWREIDLLCWLMHICCKTPLPFFPFLFSVSDVCLGLGWG